MLNEGNGCWAIALFHLIQVLYCLNEEQANCLVVSVNEAYEKANGHQKDVMDVLRELFHELSNYKMKFGDDDVQLDDTTLPPYLYTEWQDYGTRKSGELYIPTEIQGYVPIFHILHSGGDGTGGHWFVLRLLERGTNPPQWFRLDDQCEPRPVVETTSGTLMFSVYVPEDSIASYVPSPPFREEKNLTESSVQSGDDKSEATADSWKEFSGRQTGSEDYHVGDIMRGLYRGIFGT